MRAAFFLSVLLICIILIVGCLQPNSLEEKKTPTLVITSKNTVGVQNITTLPAAPYVIPRYRQGDIIDHTQNIDREPHLIIIDLNNTTGQYQYDIIFRNTNKSWGYRLYPEPRWVSVGYFEKNETYLLTHINMTDLETWFQGNF
jgi:hypothetical protein